MNPEQRAKLEESITFIEEATEQRLHAVADKLPDPERVHARADQLTERAQRHARRAEALRNEADAEDD